MNTEMLAQARAYTTIWQETNAVYGEWAKHRGISYNALFVLYGLWQNREDCTQKRICEEWMLAKQTVSTILQAFEKQGLLVFTPLPNDRRNKLVRLTGSGEDFAEKTVGALCQMEAEAMGRMGEEQRGALLQSGELFLKYMREGVREQTR